MVTPVMTSAGSLPQELAKKALAMLVPSILHAPKAFEELDSYSRGGRQRCVSLCHYLRICSQAARILLGLF